MSTERAKTAYSGWHKFSAEAQGKPADQLDIEAEIERRVQERMDAAPKKGKPKLVEPAE